MKNDIDDTFLVSNYTGSRKCIIKFCEWEVHGVPVISSWGPVCSSLVSADGTWFPACTLLSLWTSLRNYLHDQRFQIEEVELFPPPLSPLTHFLLICSSSSGLFSFWKILFDISDHTIVVSRSSRPRKLKKYRGNLDCRMFSWNSS